MNTYGIDFHAAKIQTFLERAAFFLKKVNNIRLLGVECMVSCSGKTKRASLTAGSFNFLSQEV